MVGFFCFLKYLSEKVYLCMFMYAKHQEEYPKLGLMGLLKTSLLYKCTLKLHQLVETVVYSDLRPNTNNVLR